MNHFPYFWLSSQFSFIIQPWIKICGKNFPCCYSLTVCSAYFEFNYIIAWWIKLKTYFLPCFWIVCVSSHIDIFPWATDSVSTTKIPFIFSLFAPPPHLPPRKRKTLYLWHWIIWNRTSFILSAVYQHQMTRLPGSGVQTITAQSLLKLPTWVSAVPQK